MCWCPCPAPESVPGSSFPALADSQESRLINGEKRGYWTHYSVNEEALFSLGASLQNLLKDPVYGEDECRREAGESCCGKEGNDDA